MLDGGLLLAEGPADAALVAMARSVAAPVAPRVRDRSRERNRSGERRRMGTRQARKLIGRRKDRAAFLELLARVGDPALAADRLGLPLMLLYSHRDADPVFAAEWQAAMGYAWEQVESRVLAALLKRLEQETMEPASGTKGGLLDSRLALAIVTGRDRPVTRAGVRPVDGPSVAKLRAELRELADAQVRTA
jgi:hypothetical protein